MDKTRSKSSDKRKSQPKSKVIKSSNKYEARDKIKSKDKNIRRGRTSKDNIKKGLTKKKERNLRAKNKSVKKVIKIEDEDIDFQNQISLEEESNRVLKKTKKLMFLINQNQDKKIRD